jgi:hypothetical protein
MLKISACARQEIECLLSLSKGQKIVLMGLMCRKRLVTIFAGASTMSTMETRAISNAISRKSPMVVDKHIVELDALADAALAQLGPAMQSNLSVRQLVLIVETLSSNLSATYALLTACIQSGFFKDHDEMRMRTRDQSSYTKT